MILNSWKSCQSQEQRKTRVTFFMIPGVEEANPSLLFRLSSRFSVSLLTFTLSLLLSLVLLVITSPCVASLQSL